MKHVHVEWIRSFLLSKYNGFLANSYKSMEPKFTIIAAHRYMLMSPGTQPFVKHDLFSLAVSVIDNTYAFEGSDFFRLVNHIAQYIPTVSCSVTELGKGVFTSSHDRLASAIVTLYIRASIKPCFVSPTVFGVDIEAYKRAFMQWGRSMCDGKITRVPDDFMKDFGTGQFVALVLVHSKRELMRLNRICFDANPSRIEIVNNWKELDVALGVLNVRKPTWDELQDELCLVCFCTDLYLSLYGINRKIVTLSKLSGPVRTERPTSDALAPNREEIETVPEEHHQRMSFDCRVDVDIESSPVKKVKSKRVAQDDEYDVVRIKSTKNCRRERVPEKKGRHHHEECERSRHRVCHQQLPEAPQYLVHKKHVPTSIPPKRKKEKSHTKCSYVTFDVFENTPECRRKERKPTLAEDSLLRTDQIQITDGYGAVVMPAERTRKVAKEPKLPRQKREQPSHHESVVAMKQPPRKEVTSKQQPQKNTFLLSDSSSDDDFENAENIHDLINSVNTFLQKDRGVFREDEESREAKKPDLVSEIDKFIARERQKLRTSEKSHQSSIQKQATETLMKRPRVPSEDKFEEISRFDDDEDPLTKLTRKTELLTSSIKRLSSMMQDSEMKWDTDSHMIQTSEMKTEPVSQMKQSSLLKTDTVSQMKQSSEMKCGTISQMKDPSGLKVDSASLMKHASEMNTSAVSQLKQSSEMNVDSASGVKSSGTAPGKHEMLPVEDESDYYPEEEESRLPEGPESPQLALSVSDKSDPMFKLESTKDQATSITTAGTEAQLSVLGATTTEAQNTEVLQSTVPVSATVGSGKAASSVEQSVELPKADKNKSAVAPIDEDSYSLTTSSDSIIPFNVLTGNQSTAKKPESDVPTLDLSTSKNKVDVDDELDLDLPSPTSSDKHPSVQDLQNDTETIRNGNSAIIAEDYPSDQDTDFMESQSLTFPESLSALTDVRSSLTGKNKTSAIEPFDMHSLKSNDAPLRPIKLIEDPVPVGHESKASEVRRVSFKLESLTSSLSRNRSSGTSLSESSQMSTTAPDLPMSLPVAERLRRYSKNHSRLSLSLTGEEPTIVMHYAEEVERNPEKYLPLSRMEQTVVNHILPRMKAGESDEVYNLITQELGCPRQTPVVERIATNVLEFVKARGGTQSFDEFF